MPIWPITVFSFGPFPPPISDALSSLLKANFGSSRRGSTDCGRAWQAMVAAARWHGQQHAAFTGVCFCSSCARASAWAMQGPAVCLAGRSLSEALGKRLLFTSSYLEIQASITEAQPSSVVGEGGASACDGASFMKLISGDGARSNETPTDDSRMKIP